MVLSWSRMTTSVVAEPSMLKEVAGDGMGCSPFWGAAKPSAKASSRVRSCSRLWVVPSDSIFQQGYGSWLRSPRVLKAVVVTEVQGCGRPPPSSSGGVVEGPAGGVLVIRMQGSWPSRFRGVGLQEGGQVPFILRRGYPAVGGTGLVYRRQGAWSPPPGRRGGSHLGPQHGDVGAGGWGLGWKAAKKAARSNWVPL